jgi:hypothetical protein
VGDGDIDREIACDRARSGARVRARGKPLAGWDRPWAYCV